MNTSVLLSLDVRTPKKDSTCPVLIRIVHYRKVTGIRTGIYVTEKDWDFEQRKIKPAYKGSDSVSRLNNKLQKRKAEITDYIHKLNEQKKLAGLSVNDLKRLVEKKPHHDFLYAYANQLVEDMKKAQRIGNARSYETTVKALRKFTKQKDIPFMQVTPEWLKRFEMHYLGKPGNSFNGLAVYMRTLRAIFNQAIKAKLVDKELYPFGEYAIQREKTRKRALPIEYLRRIEMIAIPPGHRLFNARNYFLVSFMLRGLSFVDLAHLKVKNLADARIRYDRQKTGAQFDIKIPADLQAILDYYMAGKTEDDYIFPIIRETEPEKVYNNIVWARKRFNKRLKELAKECSIQTNLTSYVSRHTFATRAKNLGIPIASISELLGHGDVKTTQVYLDSLPSDALDEMHERIIK